MTQQPEYLISACLCGENCRYDGKSQCIPALAQLVTTGKGIVICPEVLGGLPIPRKPCQRLGARIITKDGDDLTVAFQLGAEKTWLKAEQLGVTKAILKERSPSCGSRQIYDGTFCQRQIAGMGLTAELLREHGVTVISSDDWSLKPNGL